MDESGTVGPKKGDRARETERLRQHYKLHRETLAGLSGDAPSDHLANEYERLVGEIDMAVRKLDELEGRSGSSADTNPAFRPKTHPGSTAPGNRPLVRTDDPMAAPAAGPQWRVAAIIIAALVVLGAIAYMMWPQKNGAGTTGTIVEQQPVTGTAPPVVTPAPATIVPVGTLKITPALADYGTIRKGTRAVRQFELVNASGEPVDVQVARSTCRCLFYDYKSKLAANGKETITVTVDGARAKAGELSEEVHISSRKDRGVAATFTVQAVIQ